MGANTFGMGIIDVGGPGTEEGKLVFFSGATNRGFIVGAVGVG